MSDLQYSLEERLKAHPHLKQRIEKLTENRHKSGYKFLLPNTAQFNFSISLLLNFRPF